MEQNQDSFDRIMQLFQQKRIPNIFTDDIDDDEEDLQVVSVQRNVPEFHYSGRAMDQHTATVSTYSDMLETVFCWLLFFSILVFYFYFFF